MKLVEWHFDFGLEAGDGAATIPESDCEALWETIINWAAAHGYGVGGGYRPFSKEDLA